MSTLKQQGATAFIWDFSGKIVTHGMGFIVSIILARMLEPSDFGLIAMVMVIIGIASIFSDAGLGSALIQRRRVRPIHFSSVFYFNITLGILLSILTYFSAPYIANFYKNEALATLTQVISPMFLIGAFSAVQSTKLRKELNYTLLTKVNFFSSFLGGVVGIALAFYGAGVWSLVVQTFTQGISYNILIWYKSHWKPSLSFSFKALIQLWSFGIRLFLASILETVYTRLDTIIIGKLFLPATLGYFNRAKSLNQIVINYSSGSLMSVLFPILSKVQNNLPRFKNIIKKSLGIIIFITFFLLGGLYLVSHELIILLFGEKWLKSVDYFQILVLSGFGYPISAILVNVLKSRGNSKAFLRLEIYKKIIGFSNLAIAFIWGIEGYLYGLLIVTSLSIYLNIVFVSKEIFLTKMEMIKPILMQMFLTVIVVFIVLYLHKDSELEDFSLFLLKGIEFTILYLFINTILRVASFKYFMDEFKPMIIKIKKRSNLL